MSEFSKSISTRYEKELTYSNFKKRVPESDLKDSRSKQDPYKGAEKCKPSRDENFTNSKPETSKGLPLGRLSDHGEGTSHSGSRSEKKTKQRNVFSRMEAISGPISLLKRCVEERLHVRVKTRAAVSVRSICRGYIVAFDKYFNMAMIDVDEIYKRPAALGKVRARRTHKLIAAQKTLIKEKEESLARWRSLQESKNKDISSASSSFQALNIVPSVDELNKILTNVSKQKDIVCSPGESLPSDACTSGSRVKDSLSSNLPCEASNNKTGVMSDKDKLLEKQLRRIQSVYEGQKAPLSPYEREALMLGVPDENITIRHINQLLIRGENVVSVSIIDDL
ncbi:unnamed protein product [Lymnaea stagnalis]|uniref:LSM domain-containing protein n=1 Tax=Lymnaea stagnalis TaxID=6523 RepID=A0AAV2I9Z6_LYMST